MVHDPFRDLHEASLYTGNSADTLREYHYRRVDALHRDSADIEGFDQGAVITHVTSPVFLESPITDQINPGKLQEEYGEWPVLKNGSRSDAGSVLDHRGVVASKEGTYENRRATTRVDRTGVLESVSTSIFSDKRDQESEKSVLATGRLEEGLVKLVRTYIDRICNSDQEEVLVTVSYVSLDNVLIITSQGFHREHEIKGGHVRAPVVSLGGDDLRAELSPVIDPIWNAIGRRRSDHMSEEGWEFDS